jgi:hypothetical protein
MRKGRRRCLEQLQISRDAGSRIRAVIFVALTLKFLCSCVLTAPKDSAELSHFEGTASHGCRLRNMGAALGKCFFCLSFGVA